MVLSHAALVFVMPTIAIIRNQLEKGKRPQYPTLHQQQNTLLPHQRIKMLRQGYSPWKPIQLLPL